MRMPTRAAASAHWYFRCSVGHTMVTWWTSPAASSSVAARRAKAVLPAPGVATARKSCGMADRYFASAAACQARNDPAVPRAARRG